MTADLNKFEQRTQALFKVWALFYDLKLFQWFYFKHVYEKVLELIKERADVLKDGGSFLDAACGTGELLSRLSVKYRQAEFFGIDFSDSMLKVARRKTALTRNVSYVHANINALPFPDNSFDMALCSDALHHFAEPEKAFQEVHRVLKEHGLFILLDPASDTFLQKVFLTLFVKIWDRPKKYYAREEVSNLLSASGFQMVDDSTYCCKTNFFICRKETE